VLFRLIAVANLTIGWISGSATSPACSRPRSLRRSREDFGFARRGYEAIEIAGYFRERPEAGVAWLPTMPACSGW